MRRDHPGRDRAQRIAAASAAHRAGRHAEAEQELRALLQTWPAATGARELLGWVLLAQGRAQEASGWLLAAGRASGQTAPLIGAARALLESGALDGSADILQEVLEREPGSVPAVLAWADLLRRRGTPLLALPALEACLEREPGHPELWWRLFLARQVEGAPASEVLERAQLRIAQGPAGWLRLGQMAQLCQRFEAAEAWLRGVLEVDAAQPEAALWLIRSLTRRGAVEQAAEVASAGGEVAPNTPFSSERGRVARILQECARTGLDYPRVLVDGLPAGGPGEHSPAVPGRIAVVQWSLRVGGGEGQGLRLVEGLASAGRDVWLVLAQGPDDPAAFHAAALAQSPVGVRTWGSVPDGDPSDAAEAWLDLLPYDIRPLALGLCRTLRELRPEVVHAACDEVNLIAGVAALAARVPRIVLGLCTIPRQPPHHPQLGPIYAALAGRVAFTANSQAGARLYAEWLAPAEPGIRVVYNGVDSQALRSQAPGSPDLRHRLDPSRPLLGALLRMEPDKDPLLWLEVAARLTRLRPDLQLAMVGDGSLRGAVEQHSAALGLTDRLLLPGVQPAGPWLALMDVLLLTSRTEGLPNVLLEAQALGVPVVTTDVGGAAEAVDTGSGSVVAGREPDRLATEVLAWLDRPGSARASGPAFVESRFGLQRMLEETLGLYSLGAPKRRRAGSQA